MIRIRDLDFRYADGQFRLQIPELDIPRRQAAAVIGPSGCGKTTLLRLVAGIMLPQAGQIVTNDTDLDSLADGPRRDFQVAAPRMLNAEDAGLGSHWVVVRDIRSGLEAPISAAMIAIQTKKGPMNAGLHFSHQTIAGMPPSMKAPRYYESTA